MNTEATSNTERN